MSETRKFDVHYPGGDRPVTHWYAEEWEKLELFCPNCGKQEVWHETGPGDYYANETHLCTACEHSFHLYSGPSGPDDHDKERLKGIAGELPPPAERPHKEPTPFESFMSKSMLDFAKGGGFTKMFTAPDGELIVIPGLDSEPPETGAEAQPPK